MAPSLARCAEDAWGGGLTRCISLFEHGRVPLGMLSDENIDRRIRQWPVFNGEFTEAGPDRMVPPMNADKFKKA